MKINHNTHNGHAVPERSKQDSHGLVSVIGPCYNERDNIEPFILSLKAVLDHEKYDYEILMVNDGSTDGTAEKLEELRGEHPCLRVVHLVRNFGQQGAMLAGIVEARGAVLVTMDTDLQHPAATIPEMIRQWEEGMDVVYALPAHQVSKQSSLQTGQLSLFKSYTSRIYQSLIGRLQEPGHTYISTDFRLFDQEVAEVIRQLPEKNLYLRNVFAWLCPLSASAVHTTPPEVRIILRSVCIPYRLGRRQHGDTNYTPGQLIRLAIQGVTNGGIRPLRAGVLAGGLSLAVSFLLIMVQLLYHGITWTTWSGWEILLIAGLFFGSIQLLIMCLIGEYIGKIFLQCQGRPPYLHRNPLQENKRKIWSECKESIPLSLQKD
ncbi:glycosyltransferase family 2 protein [Membranicola marinus]|uniref:Glycosyltransferase family 2 protein n=1 Tax=Membranihabitans marinus TaxID=1227546 RepID=A0A953HXX7_9BACT|nr:glycosyltransferase family 2 protein [Membranihabitans marinus]MBY5960235.1 glycosyltransferase family 2 protein [Membranihabitans marinus]